ncbi:hypothetical protein PIB30_114360 [Stylosanthes scabra]|uniref:Uncharacterized protein n=1 Tax=Stylosanthes scabra TaxID=79078 RepID=A0ABU6V3L0_9FABA|nr:hypothetical protein [Stylosanthes scabra]
MPSLKHLYHLLSNPRASSQKNQSPDLDHPGSLSSENSSLEIPLLKMMALLKKIPQLTTQKRPLKKII